jgi:hypothetical protein
LKRLLREPGHPSSLLLLVQSAGHRWGISRASTPFRTVDETTEVKQVVAADRERWFITKKIDNRGSTDGPVKGISGCLLLSAPVVVTNSSGLVSRFDRNNHTVDRNFDIVELVAPRWPCQSGCDPNNTLRPYECNTNSDTTDRSHCQHCVAPTLGKPTAQISQTHTDRRLQVTADGIRPARLG